eukprot:m.71192 g.71192  ORF g.71192 m.71192 type:complete len:135 (-) comp50167_c0_seq2:270-674(-)
MCFSLALVLSRTHMLHLPSWLGLINPTRMGGPPLRGLLTSHGLSNPAFCGHLLAARRPLTTNSAVSPRADMCFLCKQDQLAKSQPSKSMSQAHLSVLIKPQKPAPADSAASPLKIAPTSPPLVPSPPLPTNANQ